MISDNVGAIQIEVPRDRNGTFAPQLVTKRQRRLSDMDAMVLSLFAKGLTTGEIAAHFAPGVGGSMARRCRRTRSAGSPTAWSRR